MKYMFVGICFFKDIKSGNVNHGLVNIMEKMKVFKYSIKSVHT